MVRHTQRLTRAAGCVRGQLAERMRVERSSFGVRPARESGAFSFHAMDRARRPFKSVPPATRDNRLPS